MIRSGSGLPLIFRLQIRGQLAADRATRMIGAIQGAARAVGGAALAEAANLRRMPEALRLPFRRNAIRHREEQMREFERRYEDLVGILCGAAQDLVDEEGRGRYADHRAWFAEHYPGLRPELAPWLAGETVAETRGPGTTVPSDRRDAFEALFLPVTLDASLHSDETIAHILATRAALDRRNAQLAIARR